MRTNSKNYLLGFSFVMRKSGKAKMLLDDVERKRKMGNHPFSMFLFALLTSFCISSTAMAADNKLPETSTADAPKYYVIFNCETSKYMTYNGISRYMKMDGTVSNASLWYFEGLSSEEGIKIVTKAGLEAGNNYKYLTDGQYTFNRIGKYSSSGSTFYIHQNPSDEIGCVISTSSGVPYIGISGCFEEYGANEVAVNNLGGGEDFKWIFKSYDDLLEDAAANGVDISAYENLDHANATNFQTVISAIASAKAAKQVQSPDANKKYLLRNRRYGYYLNSNGTSFYGTSVPTDYSTWVFTTIGGTAALVNRDVTDGVSIRLNTSASDHKFYSLDPSVAQSYNATVIASSDGDQRYVAFAGTTVRESLRDHTYYMAMVSSLTVEGREGQSYSSDWEFIEAQEDVNYDKVILSEAELIPADDNPLNASFFRIRNVARDVVDYASDKKFEAGGWLEDVDHVHAQYRIEETAATAFSWVQEEAQWMYDARNAEVYAAMPDMTHASALWEFVRVGRASTDNENATGVISPEHNIYIIRNANTGKYISATPAANGLVNLTENKSDAAMVYLSQLVDGQYALYLYAGTDFSGGNAGKDSNGGAFRVTSTDEGTRAGMTLLADAATVNTNSAWLIKKAPTLELSIMTTETTDGYEWSTLYYPFDVQLADVTGTREVKFFHGGWKSEPDYSGTPVKVGVVEMNEVADVPAGNPVIVRSTTNNGETYGALTLNVYPAGGMDTTTDPSVFEGNVWKGVVESEGNYFGDDWRNYWVLSKRANGELKLLHPAGNYLLPNRAYIDAESAQTLGSNVKLSSIDMIFPEGTDMPTAIVDIEENTQDGAIYNLAGQRVKADAMESLPAGIYIYNGKKILIR